MRWLSTLGAIAVALASASAVAQTKIDFFFPVPVDGKLAKEMTRLVKVYNDSQKDVAVTAVYTGSYDETKLKAQAAAKALIRAVAHQPLDARIVADTAERIAAVRASAEGKEGVAAFLDKRAPAWVPAALAPE